MGATAVATDEQSAKCRYPKITTSRHTSWHFAGDWIAQRRKKYAYK